MKTGSPPRQSLYRHNVGRRSAAALALLVFSLALCLSPALAFSQDQGSFADSGRRLLVKAAAPEESESLSGSRPGLSGSAKPIQTAFIHKPPLADPARFLALGDPSRAGAHEGRTAFTRMIVRILSPLSRRSWG